MKATWLLVVVIGSVGLMYGQAPRGGSTASLQQASAASHPESARNIVGGIERATPANNAHRQLNRKAAITNLRPPEAGGSIQNKRTGHTSSIPLPNIGRSNTLSINTVRYRGTNPAVVGAVRNSHTNNSGALDGTRMSRKP